MKMAKFAIQICRKKDGGGMFRVVKNELYFLDMHEIENTSQLQIENNNFSSLKKDIRNNG